MVASIATPFTKQLMGWFLLARRVSILLLAMLQLEQGQLDPQPIPTATQ